MPKIDGDYLRSIVILLRRHPASGVLDPVGTGFLVQTRVLVMPPVHVYLVTCEHCIGAATAARFFDGTVLELTKGDWTLAPDGDDVAVMDMSDRLPSGFPKGKCIPLGVIVPDLGNYQLGDDIYMLGLHVNERDTGRNQPRARFGNVSAWASKDVQVMQGNSKVRPTHLGDMRSRTGFSGSPVFAYYEIPLMDGESKTKAGLFGIHSDQFPDQVNIVLDGKERRAEIPSSMTKIVPAWVLAFIETDPGFQAKRDHREAEHQTFLD